MHNKRRLGFLSLLLFSAHFCLSQTESITLNSEEWAVKWDVHAEAHGFMCPFLTPMLIEHIQSQWGGIVTEHDKHGSKISAWIPIQSADSTVFANFLDALGYQNKLVHWSLQDSIPRRELLDMNPWAP